MGCEFVSSVVFMAVFLQFHFLFVHEFAVELFIFADLKVKAVNHRFQFHDISNGLVNFEPAVISMHHAIVKLIVQALASFDQSMSFLV